MISEKVQPTAEMITQPSQVRRTSHFDYLDGIRGVAALFIVLYHCQLLALISLNTSWHRGLLDLAPRLLQFGHFSVPIFIVLSGYCLSLPIISHDMRLPHGVIGFLKRRARRILPPYYAALIFGIALTLLLPHTINYHYSFKKDIELHLFMLHNFSPLYYKSFDPPMWSVATEVDIYFVFSLLLIPVFQRLNWPGVFTAALILGFAPHYVFRRELGFNCAAPWFVFGFAIGMFTAFIANKSVVTPLQDFLRQRWVAAVAVLIPLCLIALQFPKGYDGSGDLAHVPPLIADTLVEIAAAFIILQCSIGPSWLRSIFEKPILVGLGEFSYSVYLVHQICLTVILYFAAPRLHLDAIARFALCLGLLPVLFGACYIFHRLFERPFLNWKPQVIK
jgi:peptidoglycan/LPS O-acetylase OafA/YrhL